MARMRDPVCGKDLDPGSEHSRARVGDQEFAFCSAGCRDTFEQDPARFGANANPDPPYTESDGFVAPKFGSAGSGGLEHEPPPRPDRD